LVIFEEATKHMNQDISLKEKAVHGTKQQPISGMRFLAGKGSYYPDGFFVARHWHPEVEIILIKKGSYSFEINLENHILNEGDICFINSGVLHEISGITRNSLHDVLIFDVRILDFAYKDILEAESISPFTTGGMAFPLIISKEHEHYGTFLSILQTAMTYAIDGMQDWYIKCKLQLIQLIYYMEKYGLLEETNATMTSKEKEKIERYKKLVTYMEHNYQQNISLDDLADMAGCNSQYLCRFFKEITGMSPIKYLISIRIERACKLLNETDLSVIEVSMECGFDNVSYFIRKFKEITGTTPNQYRKA
jgi:AraC-like DNA-binding protein